MKSNIIKILFLDIGGVLLTNGWGHESRDKAISKFKLNCDEFTERQTPWEYSIYVDDRLMFVEVAQSLGMHVVHYQGLETAISKLKTFGLSLK